MDPKSIIVWTYVFVFVATAFITLGGIVSNFKLIEVNEKYLKVLFTALIIEVITGGVAISTDFFKSKREFSSNTDSYTLTNKNEKLERENNIISEFVRRLPDSTQIDLNRDFKRRDEILGLSIDWNKPNQFDIEHFGELSAKSIELLIKERFISLTETHNFSPQVIDFYRFMLNHPNVTVSGYAISPKRPDYGIEIYGIGVSKEFGSQALAKDLFAFCSGAREQETDDGYFCYWED